MKRFLSVLTILMMAGMFAILASPSAVSPVNAQIYEYTTNADFDLGNLNNVIHDPDDQLQLDDETTPFNFIWVAVSSKGTVVKINTQTHAIVGEYRTAPDGMSKNPSRTTVDAGGNVWVTNRDESGLVGGKNMGSVTYIGSPETLWEDRNGNGVCDTSTGFGDVLAWTNSGGADTNGGTSTAVDECIIHYVRVNSTGARHVSVDENNDVWVSGTGYRNFDLIDDVTGAIIRSETAVGCGGYGGLIDNKGVIWSARNLLRWDTSLPLTSATCYSHDSYGLGIDSGGNVWNTALVGNQIRKFAPDGTCIGTYSHGNDNAQGCVADNNDHIWVAHSLYQNSVGHILNDGTYIGSVTLESGSNAGPTGVAVDADGYIWATGFNSRKVYKIDPTAGPIGADGATPIGAVLWKSQDLGGNLYNYSDMTGSTVIAPPNNGTWTVIINGGAAGVDWGQIDWTADEPGDSSISVSVASSDDPLALTIFTSVTKGNLPPGVIGQYLKIMVSFTRSTTTDGDGDGIKDSPVLYDLTIINNIPPVADAGPDQIVEQTYHQGANVTLDGSGSTDDGMLQPLTYTWTWIGGSATGVSPTVSLPLGGPTTITLTVFDGQFSDTDTVDITVEDTTPPNITCPDDIVDVEQATLAGTVVTFTTTATDICDADPIVVCDPPSGTVFPLGTTQVTCTATDFTGNQSECSFTVTVVDTTPPDVSCIESVNPHGNIIPGKNRGEKGDPKPKNPDGFYKLLAGDICDVAPEIHVGYYDTDSVLQIVAGPYPSGTTVKLTEAPGAAPTKKLIGSTHSPNDKGQADAVAEHITVPSEPVIIAVDFTGNEATCLDCIVPPPPH